MPSFGERILGVVPWRSLIAGGMLGLVLVALRHIDLASLRAALSQADYRWAIPVLAITALNHYWRALRWQLLLRPLAPVRSTEALVGVLMGYFINLGVPRAGEVGRCVWLSQRHPSLGLAAILGTVALERLSDIGALGVVIGWSLLFQGDTWQNLSNPFLAAPQAPPSQWFWILIVAIILLLGGLVYGRRWLMRPIYGTFWHRQWQSLWQGIGSIAALSPVARWVYVAYTLLIWASYLAMSAWWFVALPATAHLGWGAAWFMLAFTSLARFLPLYANGAGAYHWLAITSLAAYHIKPDAALVMAILIHTTQLCFTLLGGVVAWAWGWWLAKPPTNIPKA